MSLDQDIAVLNRVQILNSLDREALRLVAFSADRRLLRAGDVLFRKGSMTIGAAVVMKGSIALDATGEGAPAQHIAQVGALIGELALIIQTTHQAEAVAREPSEVLIVSRALLRRVLMEFPQNAAEIRASFQKRLQAMSHRLAGVGQRLTSID